LAGVTVAVPEHQDTGQDDEEHYAERDERFAIPCCDHSLYECLAEQADCLPTRGRRLAELGQ
jgi:hypothetical protein